MRILSNIFRLILVLFSIYFLVIESTHTYAHGNNFTDSSYASQLNQLKSFAQQVEADRNYNQYTEAINVLCNFYIENGNLNEAVTTYNSLLTKLNEFQDSLNIAVVNLKIAMVYYDLGKYKLALEKYVDAENYYRVKNNYLEIITCLIGQGAVYEVTSKYSEAIDAFLKSSIIAEELNNLELLAQSYYKLSRTYYLNHDYQRSLAYNLKAIKFKEHFEDDLTLLKCYYGAALSYSKLKKYSDALDYLEAGSKLELKENIKAEKIIYTGYALVYDDMGDYEKVLEYILKEHKITLKLNNEWDLAVSYLNVGDTYSKLKRYDEGIKYLLIGYRKLKEINASTAVMYSLKGISDHYVRAGNHKMALQYLNNYVDLKDSLVGNKKQQAIEELQTSYEAEQKEKENILLKTENEYKQLEIEKQTTLRNSFVVMSILGIVLLLVISNLYLSKIKINKSVTEQKKELEIANATKDKFFSIISHDLRSPFTALLGFTELLSKDYDDYSDSEAKYFINNLNDTASRLYNLLENLLNWSKIQTGKISFEPKELELEEIISDIILLFKENAKSKNVLFNRLYKHNSSIYADEQMLQMIFRNLISNAIKFSHTNDEVIITTDETDDFVSVEIKDRGVGISNEDVDKIFKIDQHHSTCGTSNEQGTGLGLILTKEMIEKNGGSISVHSEVNKGSEFLITIPKA